MLKDRRPNIANLIGRLMDGYTRQWHRNMLDRHWDEICAKLNVSRKEAITYAHRDGYLYLMPCNEYVPDVLVCTCEEEAMGRIGTSFGTLRNSTARALRSAMVSGFESVFVPALRTDVAWFKGDRTELCQMDAPEWMCGYTWHIQSLLENCKMEG